MRIADAPAFAVGLDLEMPLCPLPMATAVRLFWQVDAIRVARAVDGEAAQAIPVNVPPAIPERGMGTLH
jgi:hypothetical protein